MSRVRIGCPNGARPCRRVACAGVPGPSLCPREGNAALPTSETTAGLPHIIAQSLLNLNSHHYKLLAYLPTTTMKVLLAALLAVTLAVAARGQGCPITSSDVSKLDFSSVKTSCGKSTFVLQLEVAEVVEHGIRKLFPLRVPPVGPPCGGRWTRDVLCCLVPRHALTVYTVYIVSSQYCVTMVESFQLTLFTFNFGAACSWVEQPPQYHGMRHLRRCIVHGI